MIGWTGRWHVLTETALYELDLHVNRMVRHRRPEPGSLFGLSAPQVASLRGDGQPVALLAVIRCALGEPMLLALDLRGDGILTLRETTTVLRIEPAVSR